jgi:Xaa-Pro aminopeptidase
MSGRAAADLDYRERIERLQAWLKRRKIDALLVSRPENRRYLSGYQAPDHGINETSGLIFVPARGEARLLTDFRYQLQAQRQTSLEVLLYRRGILPLLKELLGNFKIRRFAFESHYTLHSFSLKLEDLAEKNGIRLVPLTDAVERLRLIKSEAEIDLIRRSVALNEEVFRSVYANLAPGMTERQIAAAIEAQMHEAGADGPSFNTIVAAGVNGALPHAVPTDTVVGTDTAVTIDMGLVLDGYCSDMTRTFMVGKADDTYLRIHRLVRKAQLAGMASVKPGAVLKDVDRAARKIIAGEGHSKHFGHSLGHGVGLAVHEAPSVSFRSRRKLKAGMVITIEPGIYIPGWGGVRLENMVVVREDGYENLNRDTTDLDL